MAALSDAPIPEVTSLVEMRADRLAHILDEEARAWRQLLDWDFTPSAELVRRFVNMQALSGCCLIAGGRPVGYSYYVAEDRKGLIGDLYVIDEFATPENEQRLLAAVHQGLAHAAAVKRIECQLMMLRWPGSRPLPDAERAQVYERCFMTIDHDQARRLPGGRAAERFHFENWSERRQEDAAQLIAAAYHGHIDSQINDQYRSVTGARRFLSNIVQYPGCGSFFPPASLVAYERQTGKQAGISLASLVAFDVGHITQICVGPAVKGTGLGYELLRRSLELLARHGCRKTSLTVTAANVEAIRLYERVGFSTRRRFSAYVWEGL
jgi:ribosomal protein S18 acetylase RimI-like enzyme